MIEEGSRALVGYTGFVGGNLRRQAHFDDLYNSRNIHKLGGADHSHIVIAAPQAKKWWANQNPQEDWASIEELLAHLSRCSTGRVTLISTIDVLGSVAGLTECDRPDTQALTPYGLHRWRLEQAVVSMFERVLVVRLPGLYGAGLKKNVIYDLMKKNALEVINPRSSYQYYGLNQLWSHIETAWSGMLGLVHLFPEPLMTQELIDRFFPDRIVGTEAAPEAHYDHHTIHGEMFGGSPKYIAAKDTVMENLNAFLKAEADTTR